MTPPIRQFYKNKNIFLTGGTGFMGVITVEKLLRTFLDIGSIYLLVRPKKGITVEERKSTYFKNPVFDRLKSEQNIETFSQKLHWIEGDITKKNLGLSETIIRKLQNKINLIIHGAAELSFQLPLKCYVESNIRATYDLLKIADGCKQLRGFVYCSTAYCQLRDGAPFTRETVLKSKISPKALIKMAEEMTAEQMQIQMKETVAGWVNLYTFSKNCTENLFGEFEDRFPIAIYRPALVGHTYAEPKPYFIGNNLSLSKIFMEAHRGFVLFCNPHCNTHLVPVDLTINAMLAVLSEISQKQLKKLKVYNYATNNNLCSLSDAFRYYSNSIPGYETVLVPHRYRLMEMHEATPGSVEDKMRQKIKRFADFYKTCIIGTWINFTFPTDNIEDLWKQMSTEEKALLPFDIRACDWARYYSNMATNQFGLNLPKFDDLTAASAESHKLKEISISTFSLK